MNSDQRRKLNKVLFWLWIVPGLPVSIYLRESVTWVVVLSVYAVIWGHWVGWRQEETD